MGSNVISDRIREIRSDMNLGQADFGGIGGVKKGAQSNYESGLRTPDANYLNRIQEAGGDACYVISGIKNKATEVNFELLTICIEAADLYVKELGILVSPDKKAKIAIILYQDHISEVDPKIEPTRVRDLLYLVAS